MTEWISVKDRLPDGDDGVLVTDGENITAASLGAGLIAGRLWWATHHIYGNDAAVEFDSNVTHWMPMPPLPAKEET